MRLTLLLLLFFIHCSYAGLSKNCNKAFTDYNMRQFTETIVRYFSTYKHKRNWEQTTVKSTIDNLVSEGKNRREILRHLVAMGYLTVENSRVQNPLFDYILNKPSLEIAQFIREKPHLLYEGTLLDLPPFFLIVFIGDKLLMEASIEIDKTLTNSRNAIEEAPLHYTIDPEIVTGLLYYNAKPDAQDRKSRVALHNMRNPETVETMLYYKADPTIKDRSGISPIKHHEEFVGDQTVIALFNQARESQKITRNNHVNVTLLEENTEINNHDLAGEIRQAEQENAKRAKEAKRVVKIQQAIETRQRITEDQRNQLIAKIADRLTAVLTKKVIINKMIQYFIYAHVMSHLTMFLQEQQRDISYIIMLNKDLEQEFEAKIVQAHDKVLKKPGPIELHTERLIDELENIANELKVRLKDELQDTSVKAMKRMIHKIERNILGAEKVQKTLMELRISQNYLIGDLIRLSLIDRNYTGTAF